MKIDKLNTEHGSRSMTVTFEYAELRDISNALYELQTIEKHDTKDNKEIYAKMYFLFNMIKFGNPTSHGIKVMYEAEKALEEMKNEKSNC